MIFYFPILPTLKKYRNIWDVSLRTICLCCHRAVLFYVSYFIAANLQQILRGIFSNTKTSTSVQSYELVSLGPASPADAVTKAEDYRHITLHISYASMVVSMLCIFKSILAFTYSRLSVNHLLLIAYCC